MFANEHNYQKSKRINHSTTPDFSEEQAKEEEKYRIQLHASHAASREEIFNRIEERKEKDRLELEKSLTLWDQRQNKEHGGEIL